jgi:DNA-binding response OmpR family regulator
METELKKKFLLVEDEEALRFLYHEELEEEGYDVCTAKNVKESLQKLREEKPNLIILDIVMPEMDGMEALGRILSEKKRIPIILHTSHLSYQGDFMSWAADAYILKSDRVKKEDPRDFRKRKSAIERKDWEITGLSISLV